VTSLDARHIQTPACQIGPQSKLADVLNNTFGKPDIRFDDDPAFTTRFRVVGRGGGAVGDGDSTTLTEFGLLT
jgi:hypothetical protein